MGDLRGTRQLRRRRWRCGALAIAAVVASLGLWSAPAFSQVAAPVELHFPARPKIPSTPPVAANTPMLVRADEIKYDYPNNSVAAVGHVQIYYGGSTIEADEVVYDQKNKRLRAQETPG